MWEHLKTAFWPALPWAKIQVRFGRAREDGYWTARGIGLLARSVFITAAFYSYTAILGKNLLLLLLHIATFATATFVGQTVSNLALQSVRRRKVLHILGISSLLLQIAALSAFHIRSARLI